MAGGGLSLINAGIYNIGGSRAVTFLPGSNSARVRIVHYPPVLESAESKWASPKTKKSTGKISLSMPKTSA
jgi:hypothetical protein